MRKLYKSDFSKLLSKAREKLSSWGVRLLSMAGKATLINSFLLSVTAFQITHAEVPNNALHDIEKLCPSFLWSKMPELGGSHYVSWEDLGKPIRCSGLGFYLALKWRSLLQAHITWEFLNDANSILGRNLKLKYGAAVWSRHKKRGNSNAWMKFLDEFEQGCAVEHCNS